LFTNYSHRKAIDKIDDRLEDLENYITKSRPVEDALQNEVFDLRDAVNTIIAEMKE
jgi:chaperonin cofactor prefoldin